MPCHQNEIIWGFFNLIFSAEKNLRNNPYLVTKGESEAQEGEQKDSCGVQLALSLRY